MRTWFLCIIAIMGAIIIGFFIFNKKSVPTGIQKQSISLKITDEETARMALTAIGKSLTQCYQIVDYIDDELGMLADSATYAMEKDKEALARINARLIGGPLSISMQLQTVAAKIDQLTVEDEQKKALYETIQDLVHQQDQLEEYIQAVDKKITRAEEKKKLAAT